MAEEVALHATVCAICGSEGNADEVYPANFQVADLNARIFSARRLPDGIHYRIVTCRKCGLVRSDPVAPPELLSDLYAVSTFDYGSELANLKRTYGRSIARLKKLKPDSEALLEIGCGNGFALEEALDLGYGKVAGVEPSKDAIARGRNDVRPHLVQAMMGPDLFEANGFDAVCLFQVFDHIPDPVPLLEACWKVLKPGGLLMCFNHNVDSFSARLLKEKSPIIDIEHTYLYSPDTMTQISRKAGFELVEVGPVWNTYSPGYLAQLLPMPVGFKKWLTESRFLRSLRVTVPLGNLRLIARRPVGGSD